MKRVAPLFLAGVVGLAACSDESTNPIAVADAPSFTTSMAPAEDLGTSLGEIQLPSSEHLSDQYFEDAADRAINPSDYVCSPSSPIRDWLGAKVNAVRTEELAIFNVLVRWRATQVVMLDAVYMQTTATPQYFGYNGEYTDLMLKTEKDTKRFWDIPSDDIQMIGMHGSMLLDEQRVAATYQTAYRIPAPLAAQIASYVRDAMLQSQTLNGGSHPLFSFNAFAFSLPGSGIPDKIVMGDGILAGYEALGLGDVAPQAIYAHEFAHQIQFENKYFSDPYATAGTRPERTRYTELMADAMSAYYLTHKRGAAMNQKRVEKFLEVFFQIGDCSFISAGHHGTPNQRMAAARWGFELAAQAQKQGHILTAQQVHDAFVAAYSQLIAPDAY